MSCIAHSNNYSHRSCFLCRTKSLHRLWNTQNMHALGYHHWYTMIFTCNTILRLILITEVAQINHLALFRDSSYMRFLSALCCTKMLEWCHQVSSRFPFSYAIPANEWECCIATKYAHSYAKRTPCTYFMWCLQFGNHNLLWLSSISTVHFTTGHEGNGN